MMPPIPGARDRPPGELRAGPTPALPAIPGNVREALRRLVALGMPPDVVALAGRPGGSGPALPVSVRELIASPRAMRDVIERTRALLLHGCPLTLVLGDAGNTASRRIERVLQRLHAGLAVPCVDPRCLTLMADADELSLPAFQLMSRMLLGPGPRFVRLGTRLLCRPPARHADDCDEAWTALYQQRRRQGRLLPVYGGDVRSRCPLLSDEACGAVVTEHAILSPAGGAWLTLPLHVCRYADASGRLRETALLDALQEGLGVADRLFDLLCWADQRQRADARQNRRIVVVLKGLGDLVRLRAADPADMDCLRDLDRLVGGIHDRLWDTSRQLAGRRGLLPALAARDPSLSWQDDLQRERWRRRWQQALATTAIRHRTLLVMSPYALLPQGGPAHTGYANLLPLLAHADACSFGDAATFTDWSIQDFRQFHRRAYAIMQRRNAAAFVAAGA
ncbi:MAG: hypothetical protein U5K76_14810 [Woeseiaceae bacterium]|nr:hypothetical protein [Woeseiaceae bacterium]